MTFAEWSKLTGILPTHPTTERQAISVIIDLKHPNYPDLFHLTDYVVSSVCGIVIWLVPTLRKNQVYDTTVKL